MNIKKIAAKIKALDPGISVEEKNGCVRLYGEVEDWKTVTAAGRLAVSKKHLGVLNDVSLRGFAQKVYVPAETDLLHDGRRPDVLVIGGGLVGCATARELMRHRLDVMVAEKGADVAAGQSSRNGGAVHVGINYSPKSQKRRYNSAGNAMYGDLCKDLGVPFERKGHLVLIARKWEKIIPWLLILNSKRLSIPGVRYVDRRELLEIEPYAPSWAIGGLYMPTGGFASPYRTCVALAENAAMNGAEICLNTMVTGMETENGRIVSVRTNRGTIFPKIVVNAAGVWADKIADMAGDRTFTIHPRKGTDIILDKKVGKYINTTEVKSPVTVLSDERLSLMKKLKLIKFSLSRDNTTKGIAVIHTVGKNMILGPDAREIPDREDTSTDAETVDFILNEQFKTAEEVCRGDVIAYFSGVRSPTYEEDFHVRKGIFCENILEAAGIQSPGATAAPAIAKDLAAWAVEYLEGAGKVEKNESFNPANPRRPDPKSMTEAERDALIRSDPDYGRIVCRCEEVSKGEILAALDSPLPVYTVDAVKRRCRPGMGRCQGGFCGPQVVQILAEAKGVSPEEIKKAGERSVLLLGHTKAAGKKS